MAVSRLDFYFDFISPYAFFAWLRIREVCARRALPLEVHPILFAGVLGHWGQLGPAEIPPKRVFTFKDTFRYAALHGIEFRGPKSHPFNPLLMLRIAQKEAAGESQLEVIDTLYRAVWSQGIDPSNPAEVVAVLNGAGFDGEGLARRAGEPGLKEALRRETETAVARGVFGVPTFIAGDELFWGNDRIEFLELFLDGHDPLPPEVVAEFFVRPEGTPRPRPPRP